MLTFTALWGIRIVQSAPRRRILDDQRSRALPSRRNPHYLADVLGAAGKGRTAGTAHLHRIPQKRKKAARDPQIPAKKIHELGGKRR